MYLAYYGTDFTKLIYYDNRIDNTINNNTEILKIINTAKDKAQATFNTIKERFVIDQRLIQEQDALNYMDSLNTLSAWVNKNKDTTNPNSMLYQLNLQLQQANQYRKEQKDVIIENLANIYLLAYIDQLHKANANAYKVYDKYKDPTSNKYYQSYKQ